MPPTCCRALPPSRRQCFSSGGGADKHIPSEQRRAVVDALTDAGKPFINVEFSEADHGFNCDERPSYHATSAKLAWGMAISFLNL